MWNVGDGAIGNLNSSGDLLIALLFDGYSVEEGVCLKGIRFLEYASAAMIRS